MDALDKNGSPKPEFETDDDRSYFITRLYVHEEFLKENELKKSQKGAERKQAILVLLEQNSAMTQTMLMGKLNISRKQVRKDIKELQKDGVLVREGSNRNGRWIVKK